MTFVRYITELLLIWSYFEPSYLQRKQTNLEQFLYKNCKDSSPYSYLQLVDTIREHSNSGRSSQLVFLYEENVWRPGHC